MPNFEACHGQAHDVQQRIVLNVDATTTTTATKVINMHGATKQQQQFKQKVLITHNMFEIMSQ